MVPSPAKPVRELGSPSGALQPIAPCGLPTSVCLPHTWSLPAPGAHRSCIPQFPATQLHRGQRCRDWGTLSRAPPPNPAAWLLLLTRRAQGEVAGRFRGSWYDAHGPSALLLQATWSPTRSFCPRDMTLCLGYCCDNTAPPRRAQLSPHSGAGGGGVAGGSERSAPGAEPGPACHHELPSLCLCL